MSTYLTPPLPTTDPAMRVEDWLEERVAELCHRQAEYTEEIQEWLNDQQAEGEYPDLLHDLIIAQAPQVRGRTVEGWLAGATTRRVLDPIIETWARQYAERELVHKHFGRVPEPEVEP